jgi:hypothetical protein
MANALFVTQSGSLRLFDDVRRVLVQRCELARAGFYVADSAHYLAYTAANPEFEPSTDVVREWDILDRARRRAPDRKRVAELERRYGETLWNAIVADRRLFLGRDAVREQDYPSRYSHDQLLVIALTAAEEIESLFDRVRPDWVGGFICVTIGDYLAYLVARQRGLSFVNLRPTRIRNYFYGGEDVFEPSAALERTYRRFRTSGGIPEALLTVCREILASVRGSHAMYEGVIPAANQGGDIIPAAQPIARDSFGIRLRRVVRDTWSYNAGPLAADNHRAHRLSAHWFHRVKKPYRRSAAAFWLGPRYVRDLGALGEQGYAFFPLHKEPEVTLLVYGRPWLNQIEAVRNVARSLPAGMTLVVKEHPAALGYRPISYYRKLLDVPNVRLAAPELTSREILRHARLVTIIGGSIGLEALMLGIPTLALGHVPFAFLPNTMIRTALNVHEIDRDIAALLERPPPADEAALEAYVAAVVASSVPVDFYSVLLGRRGLYRPDAQPRDDNGYGAQVERLALYLANRAVALAQPDVQPLLQLQDRH